MSLAIDENDGVTLNRIELKYLSKKKDSYGTGNFYYDVEAEGFGEIAGIFRKTLRFPGSKERRTLF